MAVAGTPVAGRSARITLGGEKCVTGVSDTECERVLRGILRATVRRTTSDQRKCAMTGEVEKEENNTSRRPKKARINLVASTSHCAYTHW